MAAETMAAAAIAALVRAHDPRERAYGFWNSLRGEGVIARSVVAFTDEEVVDAAMQAAAHVMGVAHDLESMSSVTIEFEEVTSFMRWWNGLTSFAGRDMTRVQMCSIHPDRTAVHGIDADRGLVIDAIQDFPPLVVDYITAPGRYLTVLNETDAAATELAEIVGDSIGAGAW